MNAERRATRLVAIFALGVAFAFLVTTPLACKDDDDSGEGGQSAPGAVLSYQNCTMNPGNRSSCRTTKETSFGNGRGLPHTVEPRSVARPSGKAEFSYASTCTVNPGGRSSCSYATDSFP